MFNHSPLATAGRIVARRVRFSSFFLVAALVAASARAADYNWTGGAGNCLFSDSGNWTNELGEAVAPASNANTTFSFSFPVDVSGAVITNDVNGTVFIKSLVIVRSDSGAAEIKFVSLPHVAGDASTGWADREKYIFDFGGNSTFDVPADTTLYLNTDVGRWVNNDFTKNGAGRVVFDFIRGPSTQRGFVLNAGVAEVAVTSADTKFQVKMGGSDSANLPVFINHKDGQVVGAFDTLRNGGTVNLNNTTVYVGAASQLTGGTSILPTITGGGSLVFQNERAAKFSERVPTFDIGLDRANVIVPNFGGTAILWKFNDASNPTRDDVGSGSRMVVAGSPTVVQDETRGSVLSFTGGAHFKGPDANTWLNEFDPSSGYTVAFWMKPAANCAAAGKIFFLGLSENGKALAIRLNDSTTQNLMVTAWGGNQTPTTGNLRDGNWHHIAVTYSGEPNGSSNMKLYIDGANIHSWKATNCNPQKNNLHIGNMSGTAWSSAGSGTPYTGYMDDFVLASRCFLPQEIQSLITTGPVGGDDENPVLGNVEAKSSGTLFVEANAVSMKTLSGDALTGGIELTKPGSTLTVGANANAASTAFQGKVMGEDTTLVKEGDGYTLELSGAADAVTNVVVSEGTLVLNRTAKTRRGLVAHYAFEEYDPGLDSSIGAMRLTDTNSTPTALTRVAGGVSGSALHFPGHAHLQSSGRLPGLFPIGNASFTISVWIKPTQEATTGTVPVCCWGGHNNYMISMIRFTGPNGMQFGNWNEDMAVSGLTLTDGNWHHVVAVYDAANTTKRFYFDGVLEGEKTTVHALNITPSNPLQIGHSSVESRINQYYTGDMDEFMIFNYPWSAEEVTNEFNRVAPTLVPAGETLPVPVARWTFDDDANPGADTTANTALTLTAEGGEVTLESGDAICGKAARFSSTSGYFRLSEFPSTIIPSGLAGFSVVVRYRPDTKQHNSTKPSLLRWGNSSSGGFFMLGTGADVADSFSVTMVSAFNPAGFHRTALGTDRTRWLTAAIVVRPITTTPATRYMVIYADGKSVSTPIPWCTNPIAAQDFAIGSTYTGGNRFYGLIDDVQIYDCLLSDGQVRLISEQLESSKGAATTPANAAIASGVLTAQPDVTVADGATLSISSVETIGNLSGDGDVEIAPLGRLNLSSPSGFGGSVSGGGVVGIADGATLDFGDGKRPIISSDGPIALGANVTVNTTANPGRYLIAQAASFLDAENLATWTATVGNRPYSLAFYEDGTQLCLVMRMSTVLLFR